MSTRDQLAEALANHDWWGYADPWSIADALAPLVARLRAEAAARELEAFADTLWRPITADGVKTDLRWRAATLRAEATQ